MERILYNICTIMIISHIDSVKLNWLSFTFKIQIPKPLGHFSFYLKIKNLFINQWIKLYCSFNASFTNVNK